MALKSAIRNPRSAIPGVATLIVSCPDRRGLVAGLSQFLSGHGANIVHAEQHRDVTTNFFFQRIQFEMLARAGSGKTRAADSKAARATLEKGLREMAGRGENAKMSWRICYGDFVPRMAIFVSKLNHCLYDLILRQREDELRCEIPLIVSNHDELRPIAEQFKIPFHHLPVTPRTAAQVEAEQLKLLRRHRVDLVVLARYMQLVSPKFVAEYCWRAINIHHSFLPAFAGGRPYHQALERGVKLIGATSHYVTEALDEGPIIEQEVVRVSHRDSLDELVARGRDVEKLVLARAVKAHLENRVAVCGSKTIVFS